MRFSARCGCSVVCCALILVVSSAHRLAAQETGCLIAAPDSVHVALDTDMTTMREVILTNQCDHGVGWEAILIEPEGACPVRTVLPLPPVTAQPPADAPAELPERREDPVVALLADLDGVTILYSRAHGENSQSDFTGMISDLTLRGAEFLVDDSTITASTLEGVDVLWLCDSSRAYHAFEASEVEAVATWCRAGGSVLLMTTDDDSVDIYNDILTALDSGIAFSEAYIWSGTTTDIYPHSITEQVNSLYFTSSPVSTPTVTSGAVVLADDSTHSDRHVAAAGEVDHGRIVALGNRMLRDYYIDYADNQLFGNQVFDWLATDITWLRVTPQSAYLPAGGSMSIGLTFEAFSRCTDDYRSDLWIIADDPLTAPIRVPTVLAVTGQPDIELITDDMVIDPAYIGTTVTDTLRIAGLGCEPLSVSDIQASHSDLTVSPTSFTIDVGDTQSVVLQYQPSTPGPMAGTLLVMSNDPDEPISMVLVTGEGLHPPAISITPDAIHSDLISGGAEVHELAITNTGTALLEWSADIQMVDAPAVRDLAHLVGATIIFDLAHDQNDPEFYDIIIATLESSNTNVVFNNAPVTSELLDTAQVFWTTACSNSWTGSELSALSTWVLAGGSLLLEGETDDAIAAFDGMLTMMNSGVTVSPDNGTGGVTSNIHPHPATDGVFELSIANPLASIAELSVPAGRLVDDVAGMGNTAFSEPGLGRIVVMTDDNFRNDAIGLGDNQLFAIQVLDWLAGSAPWLTLDPRSGAVLPGSTMHVNATISAVGICTEDRFATVAITSNDPLQPSVDIAASLTVTGQPDIDIAPSGLDLGTIAIGFSTVDTVVVRNLGCDQLTVDSIVSDHPDVSVSPSSLFLDAGFWQAVVVTTTPSAAGPFSATVSFASDDPDEQLLAVSIVGVAAPAPDIRVDPQAYDVDILSGEMITQPLTIHNDGEGDLDWSFRVAEWESTERRPFVMTPSGLGSALPDTPQSARLLDLAGVTVVFDQFHGVTDPSNRSTIIADLNQRGAEVQLTTLPFIPGSLDSAQVLWITETADNWANEEYDVVVEWLENGGSLLIESDYTPAMNVFNDLLERFDAGISYARPSGTTGVTDQISVHPTTLDVHQVNLPGPYVHLSSVLPPAKLLVTDLGGLANTACVNVGWGRIVASADRIFLDSSLDLGDNQLFGNQVFDWLATGGMWLSATPDSGTVPAGSQSEIQVTFDATFLSTGDYQTDILIDSNDPYEPVQVVLAQMQVTGEPAIDLFPEAFDFGTVLAGYSFVDTLRIRNVGFDVLNVADITSGDPTVVIEPTTFAIEVDGTQPVILTFTSAVPGIFSGELSVSSDAANQPLLAIPWQGVVVEAPNATVTPDSLIVELPAGGRAIRQLTVTNDGGTDLVWSTRVALPEDRAGLLLPLEGVTILFDWHYHNSLVNRELIVNDLTMRGATVLENSLTITPDLLESVQILWLTNTAQYWIQAEIDAVIDWVEFGGSVFFEGDSDGLFDTWNEILDGLQAGLTYSADDATPGETTNIHSHPVTQDVVTVYLNWPLAQLNVVDAPAGRLIDDVEGIAVSAFSEVGLGRIVAIAEDLSNDSAADDADNRVFCNQAFDWLSETTRWMSVVPSSGVIPPGSSEVINATFDATRACGELFTAGLEIVSNDPYHPTRTVATSLTVGGSPEIQVGSDTIDFGPLFIGQTVTDTLRVANAGCSLLSVSGIVTDAADVSIDPTDFTLAPDAIQSIVLTYTPTTTGPIATFLHIHSDDVDNPVFPVELAGSATHGPIAAVSPDSLYAELQSGEVADRYVEISNHGGSDLEWSLTFWSADDTARRTFTLECPVDTLSRSRVGQPLIAELANLTGVSILYDRSHSQGYIGSYAIVLDLITRGAVVTENFDPISADILAPHDVLWLKESSATWTASEREAVIAWVEAGGSLFLLGSNDSSVTAFNGLLAGLGAGIMLSTTNCLSGVTDAIHSHPTTSDVDSIYLYDAYASMFTVTLPAVPLVDDTNGVSNIAASNVGFGRILVSANSLFRNNGIDLEDNRLFANQTFDWLSGALVWMRVSPNVGTVPPGSSMVLNVNLSAEYLCGGDHEATLIISTNDPIVATHSVHARLEMDGEPLIGVTPSAIDFGTLYVGATVRDTIQVSNIGCEPLIVDAVTSSHIDVTAAPTSFAVPVNGVQSVVVEYAPSAPGTLSEILTIHSNDPDFPEFTLPVTGTGLTAPVFVVSPDSVYFELVGDEVGSTAVTVTNTGGDDLTWQAMVMATPGTRRLVTLDVPPTGSAPSDEGSAARPFMIPREHPVVAALADLTGISVLYDRAHGESYLSNWSTLVDDLTSRGAVVLENSGEITSEVLESHDVLWITDVSTSLTDNEREAVVDWVRQGGGLLLEGDSSNTMPVYNALLGELGAGILYSDTDATEGETTSIHPHWTTTGVTVIDLPGPLAHLTTIVAPADTLIDDQDGQPNSAYSEVALGRIVAMADENGRDYAMPYADNQLFMNQVFDWLAKSVAWLSIEPTAGTVPPGESIDVDLFFDASDFCGGDFLASVVFASNDPVRPIVRVGTHLHHVGTPVIVVAPETITFGPRFLGYVTVDTLTVRNDGCGFLEVDAVVSDVGDVTVSPTSFVVPFEEEQLVFVAYEPSSVGDMSGTITIQSNDPINPVIDVAVTGMGLVAPEISVAPDSVYVELIGDQVVATAVTVHNTGGSNLDWQAVVAPTRDERQEFTLATPPVASPPPAGESTVTPPVVAPREQPVVAVLADLTDVSILYDLAHGESDPSGWSTIVDDLNARGATVTSCSEDLTDTLLAPHDVLWITDHSVALSMDEVAAITAWVQDGGGLLIEGDHEVAVPSFNALLTSLETGIEMQAEYGAPGTSEEIQRHATTVDVAAVFLSSPQAYLSAVVEPAGTLIDDVDGRPNTAYSRSGRGRVVVMTDEIGFDQAVPFVDNQFFVNQVFDWLANTASWLAVDPPIGTVPAGESVDVDLVFDSSEICGGDHLASVVFASNDPTTPTVRVATLMHHIGVPVIDVSPSSLNFGLVYVGVVVTDTLVISNEGCSAVVVSDIASAHPLVIADPTAFSLDAGADMHVTVTFAPTSTETLSSALTIVSDDPTNPEIVVPLSGLVMEGPFAEVSPDSLLVEIPEGASVQRILSVANSGDCGLTWQVSVSNASVSRDQLVTLPPARDVSPPADLESEPDPEWRRREALTTDLADLSGVSILFDRAHQQADPGNWSTIIGDLAARGADVVVNSATITPELLAEYQIFWFTECNTDWACDEIANIILWVIGGGCLVLEGDTGHVNDIFATILHLSGASLVYSPVDGVGGLTDAVYPHESTEGVSEIYLPDPDASLLVTNPLSAGRLVDDVGGNTIVAYAFVDDGRILVLSDDGFNDFSVSYADNRVFANQAFGWLSGMDWVNLEPIYGVVVPGESTEILVTIDAEHLEIGQHQAEILLLLNDPHQPEILIPIVALVSDDGVSVPGIPLPLDLRNAPNPFNPSTDFRFNLAQASEIELRIFDVRGALVRRIRAGVLQPGPAVVRWRGRDNRGAEVASGVYIYRLFIDGWHEGGSRKMTLLK